MKTCYALAIILTVSSATGCSLFDQSRFGVSAASLDPALVSNAVMANPASYLGSNAPTTNLTKNYLGLVVKDSEQKCGQFVNGLVLAETTTNTGLDMITTVFSALATAFTPVNTIHALTAGATISSGWKTAINSDIYQKATIGNYAQAIQASYYTDIGNYVSALSIASNDTLIPSIEVSKIEAIHKECSLASAQSTISSTLQASTTTTTTGATSVTKVTVQSVPAAGTALNLTATSTALTGSPVLVNYSTAAADSKSSAIAQDLANAINSNATFKQASISATAAGSSLEISWPTVLNIQWTSSPSNVLITTTAQTASVVTTAGPAPVTSPSARRLNVPASSAALLGETPTGYPGAALQAR